MMPVASYVVLYAHTRRVDNCNRATEILGSKDKIDPMTHRSSRQYPTIRTAPFLR
jgi:hypothetical protein